MRDGEVLWHVCLFIISCVISNVSASLYTYEVPNADTLQASSGRSDCDANRECAGNGTLQTPHYKHDAIPSCIHNEIYRASRIEISSPLHYNESSDASIVWLK